MLLRMLREIKSELSELRERIDNHPKLSEPEKFLTKKQAEAYLNVSERQLTYMLATGKLPFATKVGRQWRFSQSGLEQYMARN